MGIGIISTLLILLLIETLFAQIITNFLIGHVSDNAMLLIITMGLFIFTIIISIIVGFFITGDINIISVLKSSLLAFVCTLVSLFIISNLFLLVCHKDLYSEVSGFEIILIFPQVLVYFGIFILQNIFYLFILEIVIYYVFFVMFLELLFKERY